MYEFEKIKIIICVNMENYICCECQTDKNVKMRQTKHGESTMCTKCWNVCKKDESVTLICEDCGSNKNVERRYMTTESGALGGRLCKSCFNDLLYEFMN